MTAIRHARTRAPRARTYVRSRAHRTHGVCALARADASRGKHAHIGGSSQGGMSTTVGMLTNHPHAGARMLAPPPPHTHTQSHTHSHHTYSRSCEYSRHTQARARQVDPSRPPHALRSANRSTHALESAVARNLSLQLQCGQIHCGLQAARVQVRLGLGWKQVLVHDRPGRVFKMPADPASESPSLRPRSGSWTVTRSGSLGWGRAGQIRLLLYFHLSR